MSEPFLATMGVAALLLIAAVQDIRHRQIPDFAFFGILLIGLWQNYVTRFPGWPDMALTALIIGILYLATEAIWRKRGVDVLGIGDIKLMLGIGWVIGTWGLWLTVLTASLGGIAWKLARRAFRAEPLETPLPFGPFLCAGAFLAWVFQGGW